LWSASGTQLATVTFGTETSSGWQSATFNTPVAITKNTTYVVSYHTDDGNYSATSGGLSNAVDSPPLHTLAGGGLYRYGAHAFPTTASSANYWVDLVFVLPPDTTAPTITAVTPSDGATSVATSVKPTATFSEGVQPATVSFTMKNAANATV